MGEIEYTEQLEKEKNKSKEDAAKEQDIKTEKENARQAHLKKLKKRLQQIVEKENCRELHRLGIKTASNEQANAYRAKKTQKEKKEKKKDQK